MRVSWTWLSELVDLTGVNGPEDLAERLTARGLEVEGIDRQDKGFEKVITARILDRAPHPQADRLSLCKVATSEGGEGIEIVCGAQNMKAGDIVALAQIGAELPNGLKIAQSKIRGVVSNGMLCSESELKLKDSSEGILILPPDTKLGQPLAALLGRADTILTFKLTANRGDCLSHFGMAREIASMLGRRPREPEAPALTFAAKGSPHAKLAPISIRLDAGESAPQFVGVLIEGVKIGPSPDWVVRRLEVLGSRSINNVVDASNLVMLELGQPTHAYDADRIEGGELCVRLGKAGEALPLLDGSTITLQGTELVIADGKKPVGLAGVMGGGNSEVQESTRRIFLEAAEFSASPVRRAATRHGRRTDASHRFERGIDPRGVARAAARVAKLIVDWSGGKIVTAALAELPSRGPNAGRREIRVNPAYFPAFLGMPLTTEEVERVLTGLDCRISAHGAEWVVEPPSYRLDLNIREDLAEEVARSVGYDRIDSTVPPLTSMPQSVSGVASMAQLAQQDRAKDALRRAGLSEVLNYAFTAKGWLTELGLTHGASIINPLSEEWEALVPSLLPGLIQSALNNWRHHFGSEVLPIRLFELRPTFHIAPLPDAAPAATTAAGPQGAARVLGEMATNVDEKWKLAFALSGPRLGSGLRNELGEVDFYDVKAVVESLFEALGTRGVRMIPLSESRNADLPTFPLFHPGQGVEILAGNQSAGFVGLFHPGKARKLKTRGPLWIGELDWTVLRKMSREAFEAKSFKGWSEFPAMERDFALLVKADVTSEKITQLALKAGKPLAKVAKIFDVYRGSQVAEGMTSIAVRVIFYEEGRSLQESEAETVSAKILEAWKKELGAQLRG